MFRYEYYYFYYYYFNTFDFYFWDAGREKICFTRFNVICFKYVESAVVLQYFIRKVMYHRWFLGTTYIWSKHEMKKITELKIIKV